MNLNFTNGESFTTGAIHYTYSPATVGETTNRIIIPIQIEGVKTQAVVDTGAPYVVVSPRIAKLAGLTSTLSIGKERMLIRGMRLNGSIYRLNIVLVADFGEDLEVQATAFIPDIEEF